MFALTADHGVTSFPELVAQRAHRPAPPRFDMRPAFTAVAAELRQAGVDSGAISRDGPFIFVDRTAFATAHVDPEPMQTPTRSRSPL